MKTESALPIPASSYKNRVNILLIKGVIYLTSEKFSIFVTVFATLICWVGVFIDNYRLIGSGAILFLLGFAPQTMRGPAPIQSRLKRLVNFTILTTLITSNMHHELNLSAEAIRAITALQHKNGTFRYYKHTINRLKILILHQSDEIGMSDAEA